MRTTKCNKIEMIRGDTPLIHLVFTDGDTNVPMDLTGCTVYFTVKRDWRDTDAQAIFQKIVNTFDDPLTGEFDIQLTTEDSQEVGFFIYDIQVVYDEDPDKVVSTKKGDFNISQDITLNIS